MEDSGYKLDFGVAAIIYNAATGKVVFGQRKGSLGAGTWAFPGGHKEAGETEGTTAEREVLEESGLRVKAKQVVATVYSDFPEVRKRYKTFFVLCEMVDPEAEPQLLEPGKCSGWEWKRFSEIQEMPVEDLFLPIVNLFKKEPTVGRHFP